MKRGLLAAFCTAVALSVGVRGACAQAGATVERPAPREEAAREERTYELELMGSRVGTMKSVRERAANGDITSSTDTSLTMKRGALSMNIVSAASTVESAEGKPISMESVTKMGSTRLRNRWEFSERGVRHTIEQAGQSTTEDVEMPAGDWLCPARAEREVREKFLAGEQVISVRVLDPSAGFAPVTITRSIVGKTKITIGGEEVEAIECVSKVDGIAESREWVDATGELLRSDTTLGGMRIVMTLIGDRHRTVIDELPEIMVSTFVKPDKPIENPSRVSRAVLRLTVGEGEMPELPGTSAQRVKVIDGRTVEVVIDARTATPAPEGEARDARYLSASSAVNIKDQRLIEFAERALRDAGGKSTADRAEILRRAVHGHITKKSLGVALGTASEVVRTREGDCTEHGVLLTAALRAAGIPARAATGMLYVESFEGAERIFGYHMWAQALIDGVWVDLDATYPDEVAFDATHVALSVSPLDDADGMMDLVTIAKLMGRLRIEVVDVARGEP
jgi:hypothetical protein